jgi:transposase
MNSMVKKRTQIKGAPIVGIDVGMDELVCWNEAFGHVKVPNTPKGFQKLLAWAPSKLDTVFGFESTGVYSSRLLQTLQREGCRVVLVHSMHTARLKELGDNNPTKNDAKDAVVIAELVGRGSFHAPLMREGIFEELWIWSQALQRVSQQQTRLKNRIHAVTHGKKVCSEETAWMESDLLCCQERTQKLKKLLEEGLYKVPYGEALGSIPFLGKVTAARILGECGDLRQFRSNRQVLALAGLNLAERQSGRYRGKVRLTKRGRSLMRELVYLTALRMVAGGRLYEKKYKRHVAQGMPKIAAIVACSRSLLCLMVAVARNNQFRDGMDSQKTE